MTVMTTLSISWLASSRYLDRSHRQLMNRMFERFLHLGQLRTGYSEQLLGRIGQLQALREAEWKVPVQVGLQRRA